MPRTPRTLSHSKANVHAPLYSVSCVEHPNSRYGNASLLSLSLLFLCLECRSTDCEAMGSGMDYGSKTSSHSGRALCPPSPSPSPSLQSSFITTAMYETVLCLQPKLRLACASRTWTALLPLSLSPNHTPWPRSRSQSHVLRCVVHGWI